MGGSIPFDANVYKRNYQGYSAVINPFELFYPVKKSCIGFSVSRRHFQKTLERISLWSSEFRNSGCHFNRLSSFQDIIDDVFYCQ